MAEENVLQLMNQLCSAGEETRYSIEQRIGLNLRNQYLTVAVVSKSELSNGDFSCLDGFYEALDSHIPSIVRGGNHPLAFIHGRVAVVLNKWESNGTDTFYEHGERRLFDPDKQRLYRLIDEELNHHPLTERQAERTVLDRTLSGMIRENYNNGATLDNPGDHHYSLPDRQAARADLDNALAGMIQSYRNTGATLNDVVFLVYSYYIPCDLTGHHCAKLLRSYADEKGYTFYIDYTDDIQFTKRYEVQEV